MLLVLISFYITKSVIFVAYSYNEVTKSQWSSLHKLFVSELLQVGYSL